MATSWAIPRRRCARWRGEITRVSFLDPGGDLVFADFSSDDPATEVVITLEDYSGSLEDTPYDQPGTQYARGLATVTVVNPTETTWLSIFSVGNHIDRVDLALIGEETFADPVRWQSPIIRAHRHRRHGQHRNDRCEQCQLRRIIRGDRYRCSWGHGQAGPVDRGHHPGDECDAGSADQCGVARPRPTWAEGETVIIAVLIKGGDLREATGDMQIDTGGMGPIHFRILAAAGERSIGDSATAFPILAMGGCRR